MATLTRDEQDTIAGNYRSLESLAEELLDAATIAEDVEDADDLDLIVCLLGSVYSALRWLHGDLDRLNDTVQGRGDLCDECERPEDECECECDDEEQGE